MIQTFQIMPSCLGEGTLLYLADPIETVAIPSARTVSHGTLKNNRASDPGTGVYDPDRRWGHPMRLAAALGLVRTEILEGAA